MKDAKLLATLVAFKTLPFCREVFNDDDMPGPGLYVVMGQRETGKSTPLLNEAYERSSQFKDDFDDGAFTTLKPSYDIPEDKDKGLASYRFCMGGEPEYLASWHQLLEAIAQPADYSLTVADSIRMMALYRPPKALLGASGASADWQSSPTDQIWTGGTTALLIDQLDLLDRLLLQKKAYLLATMNPLLSDSPNFRSTVEGSTAGLISLDTMSATSFRDLSLKEHRRHRGRVANVRQPSVADTSWLKTPEEEEPGMVEGALFTDEGGK